MRTSVDRLRRTALVGAALLPLLVACPSAPGPLPPLPALTITPAAQSVQALGGNVTFTATLTAGSEAIAWSLTGPGSLSASAGTSTTYTPPPTFDAAHATATLTAAAGTLTATATITIGPPAPITVSGTVVDDDGVPVSGVPVVVAGQAPAMSDVNGRFSVASVPLPYDAVLVLQPSSRKLAVVYQGLTRGDPTLTAIQNFSAGPSQATVSGNLTAGQMLDTCIMGYGAPNAPSASGFASPGGGTTYSMTPIWFGAPDPVGGTIHALRWLSGQTGIPGLYRYGERAGVSLTSGAALTGQDVTLASVDSKTVSGTVSAPGQTVSSVDFVVRFASGASIDVGSLGTGSTTFSFPTPDLATASPGATVEVTASASVGGGTSASSSVTVKGLALDATGVAVAVPAPSNLLLPANAATAVDLNTIFQWSPVSGGIYVLIVKSTAVPGTDPAYLIVTAGLSTRLPDLSSLGLGLPAAKAYTWFASGLAPFASADAAAGPKGLQHTTTTLSATQTFTTK